MKTTPYLLPILVLLYVFSQPAATDNTDLDFGPALATLLASQRHPLLLQQDFSRQSQALAQLYGMNANHLLWLGDGRPEKNRADALDILSNAAADGLNPVRYDAGSLRHYVQLASSLPESALQELASFDLAISISLLRFIEDLHAGQVDPRALGYPTYFDARPTIDAATLLMRHREQQNLAELPSAVAPKIKQYQQLKRALAGYRKLAESWPRPSLTFAKPLSPGNRHPQLPDLRQRLHELGELTEAELAGIGEAETLYDEMTAAAVARLQQTQGLKADGIVGRQTLALLNQSPAEKITMIELAMERLRWLPELPTGRMIVVNIPAFELWAYASPDDQNPLNMKVIVGKADNNQTPMLWDEMEYIEFNPFWNIPRSIMTKEILPKILSNDNYLASEDIELIDRSASSDSDYFDNVIANIKNGKIRGRQRPGKKNPLGRIKFIFPNHADVYLHDTPGKTAFNKVRRDLSHGCVRVEEPERLAEFVLNDHEGWDLDAIEDAMANPKNRRVTLRNPVPVLFFYTTAMVDQYNKLRFYPDIYGQDMLLQNALNKTSMPDDSPLLTSKNPVAGG